MGVRRDYSFSTMFGLDQRPADCHSAHGDMLCAVVGSSGCVVVMKNWWLVKGAPC